MEIHAPHQPITSLREFMVHLSMVTIGILIALGLEQSVEAYHHFRLAQEARANVMSELADNKKELDQHLSQLDRLKKEHGEDLEVIDQMLAHKHLDHAHLGISFTGSTLNSASWTTASTVGAPVYMEYGDVKQFAEIYKKQDFFDHLQDDEIKAVQVILGMMNTFNSPDKVPDDDLRVLKRQLLQSDAALVVLEQLGRQLSADYGKVLPKS